MSATRIVVRVTVVTVLRLTMATCLARGAAWAEAAALRWCLTDVAVVVAELAKEAQTSAQPTAQDTAQRDSCVNFRDTEELEASCITI